MFKFIPGYEGLYLIDEQGNVWSEISQRYFKKGRTHVYLIKKGCTLGIV